MSLIKMDILFYKRIFTLLIFILLPLKSNEYVSLKKITSNIESKLSSINKKNTFFRKITINDINFELSLESQKLYQLAIVNMNKFYYKGNIQKISLYFDTRNSDIFSKYYYENNNLFFVEQDIYYYQFMKDNNKFNKNKYLKFKNKFYFYQNKIVSSNRNGKEIVSSLLKEAEMAFIHDSKLYLNIKVKINNKIYKSLYSFCKTTGIKESEIRKLNPWINKKATNIPPNAEIIIPNPKKEENNESK